MFAYRLIGLSAESRKKGIPHWTGGLQFGGLQSWATEFGSGQPLIGLLAYSLGAYSLGPPILDLGNH